jgi:hypothetical protein
MLGAEFANTRQLQVLACFQSLQFMQENEGSLRVKQSTHNEAE